MRPLLNTLNRSLPACCAMAGLMVLAPVGFAQQDEAGNDRLQALIEQKLRENKLAEVEVLRRWQKAQAESKSESATEAASHTSEAQVNPKSGQGTGEKLSDDSESPSDSDGKIYFNFDRVMWREVIQWIADEGDLALHYEDLPTGSFSYTDPSGFDFQEAVNRLNLFLLPQGYTLVRSGNLLSVINLGDPRSIQTLDALARLVRVDELENLPRYDVVKCIFPLGELSVEDAIEELAVLNLMTEPSPFNKTNQLMLTDTVSKLLSVKTIIESFLPDTLDNGTVMKNFALEYVDAEDILSVARPHLGLATGEMIGIDVSLSSDVKGKNLFVTGVEDKVKLIESLVAELDVPKQSLVSSNSQAELKTYQVENGDVEMIYNVLITLLAGKDARLSMDSESNSIVALGTPDVHFEIQETVRQLESSGDEFEIIRLKHVDPYFVISLLEEMLDLPSSYDDPDEIDPDLPRVDADPGNRRLFVRGKRRSIEQIKTIVAGLDVSTSVEDERIRILPLKGAEAQRVLETGAKFWRRENPILLYPKADSEPLETERTIHQPESPRRRSRSSGKLTSYSSGDQSLEPQVLAGDAGEKGKPINAQLTPRGLLLESDDVAALEALEENLRVIAGPMGAASSPPIVYYLKYVKPEDALRLLAELLDGGENAREAEAGSLVNGYVSTSGQYVSSILTTRDGLMTMMAGTITVVADSRLNRLIAQGTADDIAHIEEYLKIIDKDKGITTVETYGTSHVIELLYTDASEVAATVNEAFATRIAQKPSGAPGNAGNANEKGRNEDASARSKSEKGNKSNPATSSTPARNLEPTMTIAVHEPSNSLIVTAPDQLFREVERLVQVIDVGSQQTVEVIAPENTAILQAMLGDDSGQSRSRSSSRSGRSSESNSRLQSMLRERYGR